MGYKLKLRAEVMVFDNDAGKYIRKGTTIDFKLATAAGVATLIKEMALYADDPLDFTISREDA